MRDTRRRSQVLTALIAAAAAACGGTSTRTAADDDADGGQGTFTGGDGGTLTADGCTEAAKLVYVVTEETLLYSFDPGNVVFTRIGSISCPSPGVDVLGQPATPNSMAVDRSGVAWVNYSSGKLYKVSTSDATCQSTSFRPGQHGFRKFGMAFSSNAAGTNDETLFVVGYADPAGLGLATIDLGSLALTTIGDFTDGLTGQAAELTGTGDAKLYGFFTPGATAQSTLAEIAKDTAETPSATQAQPTGLSAGTAWAFSFWGGDFWFYTAASGQTSRVTRYKASSDRTTDVVKQNLGYRIVGAGVSTCAPLAPPK